MGHFVGLYHLSSTSAFRRRLCIHLDTPETLLTWIRVVSKLANETCFFLQYTKQRH